MLKNCGLCKKKLDCKEEFKLQKCKHTFCLKCLYHNIMENFGCTIKCPEAECQKYISDPDIRKFLPDNLIESYESSMKPNSNINRCITKECKFIFISKNDDVIFKCPNCEQPNCLKCKKRHFPDECSKNVDNEEVRQRDAINILKNKIGKEINLLNEKYELIPNHKAFECPICFYFFLPREGIILRNCHHEFCKTCLELFLTSQNTVNKFVCPNSVCSLPLQHVEMQKLVGKTLVDNLNQKEVSSKCFRCKTPNCTGFWCTSSKKTGFYECYMCKKTNCISCSAVHEGKTCEEYIQTDEYKQNFKFQKKLAEKKCINCICGTLLIQEGGCGALFCNHCSRQICVFTGRLAGKSFPEGCGCSKEKLCDKECRYGCIPEYSANNNAS